MNSAQKVGFLVFYLLLGIINSNAQFQINGVIHVKANGTIFIKSNNVNFGTLSKTTTSKVTPYQAIDGKVTLGTNSNFVTDGTIPKFVNGYAGTVKNIETLLAIGTTTIYAPVQVLTPTNVNGVHAAYFDTSPLTAFNGGLDASVLAVADTEYWIIKGENSKISLSWRTGSALSTFSFPCVKIVGYRTATSKWEVINSKIDVTSVFGGLSSLSGTGSITSNSIVSLSEYAAFAIGESNIITPTFTQVNPICSGATLAALPTTSLNGISGAWLPALNNLATTVYTFTPNSGQCSSSTTMTITVNPIETPIFSQVNPICSGATLPALPTTSTNGISGTWSPVLNNTATTTYTFTPNSGQCSLSTTMTITVNPIENPIFSQVNPICSGATLPALPTTSTNGISGTWSPVLNNTATTTYTFTPNSGQCSSSTTMTITVNPIETPIFANVNPICEGENLAPLPTISQNGISGIWSPSLDNTTTTTYNFTPNAGQCAIPATMTIVVNNAESIDPIIGDDSVCIGNTLPLMNATAGGTWSSTNPNVATIDADGLVTPLTPGFTEIIYTTTSLCAATSIDFTVYLPPNPLLTDKIICVDPVTDDYLTSVNMQCGVPNEDHTFVWTLDGEPLPTTTNLHEAAEEGEYKVTVTNNITGCSASSSAHVFRSSKAIAEATVAEDFDQNQIITITVTNGSGVYEYQLDNNWPQSSNQFIVQQGEYTITVIDKNGCDNETLTVFALNYPRYFTPNADGFNDTWSIEGLVSQLEAQIFIFDRYGKLLKAIRPYLNEYWDGTFNGSLLPATDYWFTLKYINNKGLNKEFRSNFSLKR